MPKVTQLFSLARSLSLVERKLIHAQIRKQEPSPSISGLFKCLIESPEEPLQEIIKKFCYREKVAPKDLDVLSDLLIDIIIRELSNAKSNRNTDASLNLLLFRCDFLIGRNVLTGVEELLKKAVKIADKREDFIAKLKILELFRRSNVKFHPEDSQSVLATLGELNSLESLYLKLKNQVETHPFISSETEHVNLDKLLALPILIQKKFRSRKAAVLKNRIFALAGFTFQRFEDYYNYSEIALKLLLEVPEKEKSVEETFLLSRVAKNLVQASGLLRDKAKHKKWIRYFSLLPTPTSEIKAFKTINQVQFLIADYHNDDDYSDALSFASWMEETLDEEQIENRNIVNHQLAVILCYGLEYKKSLEYLNKIDLSTETGLDVQLLTRLLKLICLYETSSLKEMGEHLKFTQSFMKTKGLDSPVAQALLDFFSVLKSKFQSDVVLEKGRILLALLTEINENEAERLMKLLLTQFKFNSWIERILRQLPISDDRHQKEGVR